MTSQVRLLQLPSLSWLLLYAVTLAASLISAWFRALAVILVANPVCLIMGWPRGWIYTAALVIAALPLVWSVLALVWPWEWLARQQTGARPPSDRELAVIDDALERIAAAAGIPVVLPSAVSILDGDELTAFVIGREVFMDRALLSSPYLGGVLAHELGHVAAGDGVHTVALSRLAFFPGLLCGRPSGPGAINRLVRGLTYAASGELALRLVSPIWGGHWRDQEYRADQYAAHLGQGPKLARFLEQEALLYDLPVPFVWMTDLSHPFSEERINRLPTTEQEPDDLDTRELDEIDPIRNVLYHEPMLPPIGDS